MTNKEQLHHQFLVEDSIGMLTNAELQDFMSEVQSIMSDRCRNDMGVSSNVCVDWGTRRERQSAWSVF